MKALLIPSAVLMPREMRKIFGDLPTALFPLADRPMLYHLCQSYRGYVDEIYIVCYEQTEQVKSYIKAQKLPVQVLVLDELRDLGYTIYQGVQKILEQNKNVEYLYINFADTLLYDAIPSGDVDFLYYAVRPEDEAWTYFEEHHGEIETVFDKPDFRAGRKLPSDMNKVFVGQFGFSSPKQLLAVMADSLHTKERHIDLFYHAISSYSLQKPFRFIEAQQWFDVGHNENYRKARTEVAARSFNSIRIDERRGLLRKTSENREKLVNEIRWYLKLPSRVQYLTPRIYDYSLDIDNPYVIMEYYGYHTLHDSFVFGNWSDERWREVFSQLLFIVDDMGTFILKGRSHECMEAMREIYLDKTVRRLEKIRKCDGFRAFFTQPIYINGRMYNSLEYILQQLPDLVERLILSEAEQRFQIIHGDLCFSNILLDDTLNFMRLIDPRGKFGVFDIYGDVRYEIAKIFHTLEGGYDFIIEDLFEVSVEGSAITYQINISKPSVFHLFCDVFQAKLESIQAIRLIEATLFLSMIPLHSDYPTRQYVMLARGVELFYRVLEEDLDGKATEFRL
ncbi:sugar phosphate nucleotidyltransferase [uncultured Selenomonas sp.]|uniref:sugar phosphate nucleotidyltransferase n=1 Tax=uncultured Selenomonas sp. TaxID=159275 RepID=UPI0028D0E93D|nr:sugar phosphate nucleotidyltransferase [uncultured Selenomonas sp.]